MTTLREQLDAAEDAWREADAAYEDAVGNASPAELVTLRAERERLSKEADALAAAWNAAELKRLEGK